jgi:hypothetical protein
MQEASGGKKKFWARLAMSALVGFILGRVLIKLGPMSASV